MENRSKITVKPFLNKRIVSDTIIIGDNDENGEYDETLLQSPLYMKVTFQRKSTEIKSMVKAYFSSLNQISKEQHELMNVEIRMIEDIVAKEYNTLGEKFTLKGLKKRCEYYQKYLYDYFSDSFLWEDFKITLLKSRSEYARVLLTKNPEVPVSIYYRAALKLIPTNSKITEFKERFEMLEQITNVFRKIESYGMILIASWKYGNVKDQFAIIGLRKGLTLAKVNELISMIDLEIDKGEK